MIGRRHHSQLAKPPPPIDNFFFNAQLIYLLLKHVRIQRGGGGRGFWTPLKNHKNIGFSSNTGLDSLKNHKATKPAFEMLGHHRHASETQFKWCFAGGPMMAPLITSSKTLCCQSWTPSDKIFWIRACTICTSRHS